MIKRNLLTVLLGSLVCASAMAANPVPSAMTPAASALLRDLVQTAKPALDDQQARRKPRVRGGSGCDDPGDIAEHPECGGAKAPTVLEQEARRKPRVKGGSGCDTPQDVAEHPECRALPEVKDDLLSRSKPRIRGGSGCDDPGDAAEHPAECGVIREERKSLI